MNQLENIKHHPGKLFNTMQMFRVSEKPKQLTIHDELGYKILNPELKADYVKSYFQNHFTNPENNVN